MPDELSRARGRLKNARNQLSSLRWSLTHADEYRDIEALRRELSSDEEYIREQIAAALDAIEEASA